MACATELIKSGAPPICGAGEVVDLHDENANLWVNPITHGGGIELARGQIGSKALDRFRLCGAWPHSRADGFCAS